MNARELTFKALNKILISGENSDTVLNNTTVKINISKQEKNLLYALTKGIIKRKLYLDYIINWLNQNFDFKISRNKFKNLIRLGLYQLIFMNSIPDYAAVNETVNVCRKLYISKLANKLNAILRLYLRKKNLFRLPQEKINRMSVEYSFPEYLIENWLDRLGAEATEDLCSYFNRNPNLNLHFYGSEVEFQEFLNSLKQNEIGFSVSDYFQNSVKIHDNFDFRSDYYFDKGKYYIQDESAFLPVELLDVNNKERILDLCAAPGGKTFDIASKTKTAIYANDIDMYRLNLLKENAKRLNFDNIKFLNVDGTNYSTDEKFDKILLDAPCSGYGVIQKKPEIRLKSEENYKNLLPRQQKLLKNCAHLLKPEGVIVYSTCTMNIAENQDQINKFLQQHENFFLEDSGDYVDEFFVNDKFIETLPHIHKMDGSFAARLRKKC